MERITRAGRARVQRQAQQIRQREQLAGRDVPTIAAIIQTEVSGIHPLEAWRLAYGWSRPRAIAGIANLYRAEGLAAPAMNSSMLCRWEHGSGQPGLEYGQALCRLYGARADQLGLTPTAVLPKQRSAPDDRPAWQAAAAVRESVELAMQVEGPAGGRLTVAQLAEAVRYFAADYSRIPPLLLTTEVHRCRTAVSTMLNHSATGPLRGELRVLGGWLSALLGNLAHHRGEHTVADIHLRTAAGLATDAGQLELRAWALWAQSMVARVQGRPVAALDLARLGNTLATTPLRRAQGLAWAEVPALVALGRDPRHAIAAADRAMDAAAADEPGRFGFDRAEFHLHLAEAYLATGDAVGATEHARISLGHTAPGRPNWVAAALTLARARTHLGDADGAADLATRVLDLAPVDKLRDTSRRRLRGLAAALANDRASSLARDVGDRVLGTLRAH